VIAQAATTLTTPTGEGANAEEVVALGSRYEDAALDQVQQARESGAVRPICGNP